MTAPTPRTTAELVAGIVEVATGVDVTPFIATANMLTTDVCGSSDYSDGYEGSKMELIERWLAAHFYKILDMQLAAAKAGTVSVQYQYKVDFGLQNTAYGQQAIMLDTAGNLAKLENSSKTIRKITLDIGWMGKTRWDCDAADADVTVEQ